MVTWSHMINVVSGLHADQGGWEHNQTDGGGILCTEHFCRVRYNKAARERWYCIHGKLNVCMYVCVCMYTCTYVCMYVCTYVCMYVHLYLCMHVYIWLAMYLCCLIIYYNCIFLLYICSLASIMEVSNYVFTMVLLMLN